MRVRSGGAAGLLLLAACVKIVVRGDDGDAVFIREFTLIRRDHLSEELQHDDGQKTEDQNSRSTRSEEDRETLWDAWGSWSECSRTCGGGASYSLRRCLSSRSCNGQNIKYRTCSNVDCPDGSEDFRSQQCLAHADVRHQGRYHEWLPVYNDPQNPCSLKCKAKDMDLVVELAPKVLDGTRCYTESLDMCISGVCQIVGCDHELGSPAKEDNCGVCNGDGASCRLVRGNYKLQHALGTNEVVMVPYMSRHIRLVLKGPDHLSLESKTLDGVKDLLALDHSGQYHLENTTVDFQKLPDKQVVRINGPLAADFTVKAQPVGVTESAIQYIFYQPIPHRWRQTDFFPCSATCGGGYQLTSAECVDFRSRRVVLDQFCHYHPENIKPKPKLQECNLDPCPARDGYKQIMPYDLYHPLPRWESGPWTSCSASCGGGVQSRSVSCVEEDVQGNIIPADEWKCLYATKTPIMQPCNSFTCPHWQAQEWSPCTVSCGQGLRYRVVLCLDHRGLHAGGCNPTTKPHIKEECVVTTPCYKSREIPPEQKIPAWNKQAMELEEREEPTWIAGQWEPCSKTCGTGVQQRTVSCQVLLSFSQALVDVPEDECEGVQPVSTRPCYQNSCPKNSSLQPVVEGEDHDQVAEEEAETHLAREQVHEWEYNGFKECSQTCGGGVQQSVIICVNQQTEEEVPHTHCLMSHRPPSLVQNCSTQPCPPRWVTGSWTSCSASCGIGLMSRSVVCSRKDIPIEVLAEEACAGPKPVPVQVCNRLDCPPGWEVGDWQQCSQSCGGGVQLRQVVCRQRLADGRVLDQTGSLCTSKRPANHQTCSNQECPAEWLSSDWTKCSVTCGAGTQRRQVTCQRLGDAGSLKVLDPKDCSTVVRPTSVRPCSQRPCNDLMERTPSILGQRKLFIQLLKVKKVHLVIGGFGYLLPSTTVVLRCPTRHFLRSRVRWLKDGKPLLSRPHLYITSMGNVKIHQVRASDSGVYTCVAGAAQEHLVIQITGNKRKLSLPKMKAGGDMKVGPSRSSLLEQITSLHQYDHIADLLRHKHEVSDIALKSQFSRRNKSSPSVFIVDTARLDELVQKLSGGPQGWQLLQSDTQKSALTAPEISESPTLPPDLQTTRSHGSLVVSPGSGRNSSELIVHVGGPVVLRKPVASLEIRCESLGDVETSVSWTKNGRALIQTGRVEVLKTGALRIQTPSQSDEGLYTCTTRSLSGSASLTSVLQVSGERCDAESCHAKPSGKCVVQHCPFRWHAEAWTPCSASCGDGLQTRSVRCLKDSDLSEVKQHHCSSSGKKPPSTQSCFLTPCFRWVVTRWGPCRGTCSPRRHVYCQHANGTRVSSRMCVGPTRLHSVDNCSSDACSPSWQVGPWTQCTASCGRHGFQSRQVTCVDQGTGKVMPDLQCLFKLRPHSWQRCNVQSCGQAGKCQDSTRYCEKVQQLDLCSLPQFQTRCCQSCHNT
ncbi:ADAMTS-like protein 1 isoform X1 [Synchiropus splendidus]|uniref:ADAMTS-like protein 1 isoform X1 n=1 Tax=Synchiropus splendidus TaxID=270530 RepID=UPI00237DB73C|nr:ADAMTS-like protein 1 isoform X1 [Synchiropus splendidus]